MKAEVVKEEGNEDEMQGIDDSIYTDDDEAEAENDNDNNMDNNYDNGELKLKKQTII